jgi:chromosome segregation ATPase
MNQLTRDKDKELVSLRHDLDHRTAMLSNLEGVYNGVEDDHMNLSTDYGEIREQYLVLKRDQKILLEAKAALEETYNVTMEDNEILQTRCTDLSDALSKTRAELNHLRNTNLQTSTDSKLKESQFESLQSIIYDLEKKVEYNQSKSDDYRQHMEQVNIQREALIEEVGMLSAKLRESFDALEQEQYRSQQLMEIIQTQQHTISSDINSIITSDLELKEKNSSVISNNSNSSTNEIRYKELYDQAKQQLELLEQEKLLIEEENHNLSSDLNALYAEKQKLIIDIEKLKRVTPESSSSANASTEKLLQIKKEATDFNHKIFESQNSSTQDNYYQTIIEQLEKENKGLLVQIQHLKQDLIVQQEELNSYLLSQQKQHQEQPHQQQNNDDSLIEQELSLMITDTMNEVPVSDRHALQSKGLNILRERLDNLTETNKLLLEDNNYLNATLTALKESEESRIQERMQVLLQANDLNSLISNSEKTVTNIENTLLSFKAKLEEANMNREEDFVTLLKSQEVQISTLSQENKELKKKLGNNSADTGSSPSTIQQTQTTPHVESVHTASQTWQSPDSETKRELMKIQELTQETDILLSKVRELEQENLEIRQQVEAFNPDSDMQLLLMQIGELQEDNKQLTETVAQYQEAALQYKNRAAQFKEHKEILEQEFHHLKNQWLMKKEQHSKLEGENAEMRGVIKTLESLQQSTKSNESSDKELKRKVDDLQEVVQDKKNTITNLQVLVSERKDMIDTLTSQLNSIRSTLEREHEEVVEHMRDRIRDLESENQNRLTKLKLLEQQMAQTQSDFDTYSLATSREKRELELSVTLLNERIQSLADQSYSQQEKLNTSSEEESEREKRLRLAARKMKRQEDEIERLKQESEKKLEEFNTSLKDNKKLASKISKLQEKITQLTSKLNERELMSKDLENVSSRIAQLEQNFAEKEKVYIDKIAAQTKEFEKVLEKERTDNESIIRELKVEVEQLLEERKDLPSGQLVRLHQELKAAQTRLNNQNISITDLHNEILESKQSLVDIQDAISVVIDALKTTPVVEDEKPSISKQRNVTPYDKQKERKQQHSNNVLNNTLIKKLQEVALALDVKTRLLDTKLQLNICVENNRKLAAKLVEKETLLEQAISYVNTVQQEYDRLKNQLERVDEERIKQGVELANKTKQLQLLKVEQYKRARANVSGTRLSPESNITPR